MRRKLSYPLALILCSLVALSHAQDPKSGGVYKMVSAYDIPTLDPAEAGNFENWWSAGMILFQPLYLYDVQGDLMPAMAADMPDISEDGLTYTIPLRQGVKFCNGREMTADDVIFTFERLYNPTLDTSGPNMLDPVVGSEAIANGEAETLAGLKKIDNYTVQFTLKEPRSTFLLGLGDSAYSIVPKEEVMAAGEDWGTKELIGTGPFCLSEFAAGESVTYTRNENYYKEGLPYLDGVEISLNVPAAVAQLRVESEEATFAPADALAGEVLAQLQSEEAYQERARIGSSGILTKISINPVARPFQDLRVRQAIAHAIDKDILARRSGRGVAFDSLYPPSYTQHNPDFSSAYTYDLERAKALLVEAGYSPENPLTGYALFAGQGQSLGEIIQADLREIGIEIDVLTGNFADYEDRWLDGEIALTHFGWGGTFLDAQQAISGLFTCPSEAEVANNPRGTAVRWCDSEIDALYAQAESLKVDDPERTALYQELEEKIVNEKAWVIVPYRSLALAMSQPYAKGDDLHPIFTLPTLEAAWLDQ